MTGKVAIVSGAAAGTGAGLVAGYRGQGWTVVASARTIRPSDDPGVLAIEGDLAGPETADRIVGGALGRFGPAPPGPARAAAPATPADYPASRR